MRFSSLQTQAELPPPPPPRPPTFWERILETTLTMVVVNLILRRVLPDKR